MKCVHTFGTGSHKRQADITLLFQYIFIKVACQFSQTIWDLNALPESLICPAEIAEDCIAKLTYKFLVFIMLN